MKFTDSQNQFMRSNFRPERPPAAPATDEDIRKTMARRTIEEFEELRRIERDNMDVWNVDS